MRRDMLASPQEGGIVPPGRPLPATPRPDPDDDVGVSSAERPPNGNLALLPKIPARRPILPVRWASRERAPDRGGPTRQAREHRQGGATLSQVQQPSLRKAPSQSDQTPSRLSRRALLTGAAIGAFWGAEKAKAGPNDNKADVDPNSLVARLVNRITCGFNQTELQRANTMGYAAYLEYQLNYAAIPDGEMDARLASLTTLQMTQQQLYAQSQTLVINELIEAAILRSTLSQRQLYQRMVEFWTDHF